MYIDEFTLELCVKVRNYEPSVLDIHMDLI